MNAADVDRYITGEVLMAVYGAKLAYHRSADDQIREEFRAALPGILAQHRADVLREAAERLDTDTRHIDETDRDAFLRMARQADDEVRFIRRMADEAVAE